MSSKVGQAIESVSSQYEQEPEQEDRFHAEEMQLISWHDPRYLQSVNYEFGDMIMKFDPPKYRRTVSVLTLSVQRVQLEFCEGRLHHLFEGEPTVALPLIQLIFKQIQAAKANHLFDNSFDPFTKVLEQLPTKRYKSATQSLPAFLEVDATMNFESKYFNQITQVFEPFIEPWSLQAFISQKVEKGLLDVSIKSTQLLNVNITYAMALCLRNISAQITKTLRQIDKAIAREADGDEQHSGHTPKRGILPSSKSSIVTSASSQHPAQASSLRPSQFKPSKSTKTLQNQYLFQNKSCLDMHISHSKEEEVTHEEESKQHEHGQDIRGNFSPETMRASEYATVSVGNDFWSKESRSLGSTQVEKDLLLINIQFEEAEPVSNVQIEKNGYFSYPICAKLSNSQEDRADGDLQEVLPPQNFILEIQSSGLRRSVQFQSQLELINHVEYPISLEFRFMNQHKQIVVDLEPESSFKVPLKWYFCGDCIDLYLVPKEDDNNSANDIYKQYLPLCSDITKVFSKTMKNAKEPTFKEGVESKVVQLSSDFHVSVDIKAIQCGPVETADSNALFYSVSFNAPLVIENRSMMLLHVSEIADFNSAQESTKLLAEVPPSMSDTLLQLDTTPSNKSYFKFQFRDIEQNQCLSKVIPHIGSLQSADGHCSQRFLAHKDRTLRIADREYETDFCFIEMEVVKQSQSLKSMLNAQLVFEETSNIHLQLYPKYMLVNKTRHDIFITYDQRIKARSNDLIPLPSSQSKLRLSCMYYKDSIEIDLSKIGLTGEIEMKSKEERSKKRLQFAIQISQAPAPYNKTTILTVSPRYILVNMLDYPVLV